MTISIECVIINEQKREGGERGKEAIYMSAELKLILEEIKGLKSEIFCLRRDMKKMETSLREEIHDGDTAIRLILENDIRPKINILAENHLDLNRKLDEVRKELKKNELLPIRVSILEKDVNEIKKQSAMSV